jgi:hypothetical protein
MMRLDKLSLKRIQKIWEQTEDGLALADFLKLMYE